MTPMTACRGSHVIKVAQGHFLAARHLKERVRKRPSPFCGFWEIGNRAIEQIAGNVIPDPLRDQAERIGWGQPTLQLIQLLLCLFISLPDDRHDTWQGRYIFGSAAILDCPLLEAVISGFG